MIVAEEVLRQSSFNGGELTPRAHGRRDLKAYASSLALSLNMLPATEGPMCRRPGLAHVDVVRNRLEPVELDTDMLTAPNGGSVADLIAGDGLETTAVIGTDDPHVLLEIDFGAPVEIGGFDLTDFALTAAGAGLPDPTPPQYPWGDDQLGVMP